MKRTTLGLIALLAATTAAHAQTLYRWLDKDGKVHYSDQPPPRDARKVQTPKIRTNVVESTLPFATRKATELYPVTLYTAANCKSECDMARDFLKRRGIPYSETKLASADDREVFKKLFKTEDVFVPSLTVGSRNTRGYEQGAWNSMLDDAGYPPSAPPGMPAQTASGPKGERKPPAAVPKAEEPQPPAAQDKQ